MMVRALADVVRSAENFVKLKSGDIVVDIGANDGTLLQQYTIPGINRIGFEPATNLIPKASKIIYINNYFNSEDFIARYPESRARIVTAVAMFYDLDDPNKFVADVKRILDDNGLFIIQMNYLGTMIELNTFDNICHEHLEYYSLGSLSHLLSEHGFEIFHVEINDVNGGSFRTYIRKKGSSVGSQISHAVVEMLETERRAGLDNKKAYLEFGKRVASIGHTLAEFIKNEVKSGKRVYVNGASTRGSTILQYAGLDSEVIPYAADLNPSKFGRMMVGTWIPIISKAKARAERPDYYLILPYGFLDEIKQEEKEYLENGGKFIVPIPHVRLITKDGELRIV
jgi:SAM-dependent methyltransferase